MVNNELKHHGILGMRWGIRRFQNKNGSLTAKGKQRYSNDSDDQKEDSIETKRSKLLKSTDAKELYKNRNLLSTQELNERINRIDTERRLGEIASRQTKSGYDRINSVLKFGRKVNEIYEFTNTPIMKQIKKKLFGDKSPVNNTPDLRKALSEVNNLSDDQLSKIIKRANSEKMLKNLVDQLDKN